MHQFPVKLIGTYVAGMATTFIAQRVYAQVKELHRKHKIVKFYKDNKEVMDMLTPNKDTPY